jgi:hypothetical protein
VSRLAVVNLFAAGLIVMGMYWPFPGLGASLTTARPMLLLVPLVLAGSALVSLSGSRRAVMASASFDGAGLAGFGLALTLSALAPNVESLTFASQVWLASVLLCLAIALFLAARLEHHRGPV